MSTVYNVSVSAGNITGPSFDGFDLWLCSRLHILSGTSTSDWQALSAYDRLNLSWPPLVISFLGYLSIFYSEYWYCIRHGWPRFLQNVSKQLLQISVQILRDSCHSIMYSVYRRGFVFLYSCYFVSSKISRLLFRRKSIDIRAKRSPTVISQLLSTTLLAMKFLFLTLATKILSIINCTFDNS